VVARGNSSVVAWGNSSVVAWGNSSVVARENSSVVARGNSSVVAWGNSSVVARENSSVEAWGNSAVRLSSDYATVALFAFSVCWELAKGKIIKKAKTATVIVPKYKPGVNGWLEKEGIEKEKEVIVYKRVSSDFKTQEGSKNETLWSIGKKMQHHDYNPEKEECGEGKFHACSRTYFCDEFRKTSDDKYIAISVNPKDMYAWENPQYPHKIAFEKGTVLYECDKKGNKLTQ
jgi:hypothetical protein